MNKIMLLIVIAVGVIIGILISSYILHLPFAESITDAVFAKLGDVNIAGLNIGSIASIASIGTAATSVIGWVKSNKEKVMAQKAALEQQYRNSGIAQELTNVSKLKEDAETKLSEVSQLKDNALEQVESAKTELSTIKTQLQTAQSQIKALEGINTNTIENLWKNSGSDFWTDPHTGEKYKLLPMVTEIVK
jgi:uncharacterized protein (DUF3084 family)